MPTGKDELVRQNRLTPTSFIHPVTKEVLFKAVDGTLAREAEPHHPVCPSKETIYDFASLTGKQGERLHYDDDYREQSRRLGRLSLQEARQQWQASPDLALFLTSLGDLDGKRVLLLGNGLSLKEFYFLSLGARCVYTDLSVSAVQAAREAFISSELAQPFHDRIEFHAADALHLPFADASFDIVYGCAFVHHVQDLRAFFWEVGRILKRGGRCHFLDDAYSPVWQFLKRTVLYPLQAYSHRKHGISPEDLIATRKGGFRRSEIERMAQDCGFCEVLFARCLFFEYFCSRGALKLGGQPLLPFLLPLCRGADAFLDRWCRLTRKHGLRLVWGLQK